jgi:N-dimethylarginine dimethylaminohydrolase
MCPPTYFDVTYSINPWMDPSRGVDRDLAMRQWSGLVDAYRDTGHRVDLLEPVPGMPDMVFAANGATVVDGRALAAHFANTEREAEAAVHTTWHRRNGILYGGGEVRQPIAVNEAEGDFAMLSKRILAGHGFRTTVEAHRELASLTGQQVISLELVDPRLFHLDLALAVLDDERDHIAYYPDAFSAQSRQLLAALFPDALIANEHDAYIFGLNAVSDGLHVFIPSGARQLREDLAAAGYWPISIDLSELMKGGGSVKCCTQEIRAARIPSQAALTDEGPTLFSHIPSPAGASRIARRRAEDERADTPFVCERGRSRRLPSAIRAGASEASGGN